MAAMSTTLVLQGSSLDQANYSYTGHTGLRPKLVLQRRVPLTGNRTVMEDSITVLEATEDDDGALLPQKVTFQVIVKRPALGQAAEVTSALAVFRDIVASDEFGAVVTDQALLS